MYVPSYPNSSNLVRVSKENPCPHCGKPDWCYSVGELSVCKRNQPPATGWEATSKADAEGTLYYAPVQEKKAVRPAQTRYWEYPARDGSKLARVKRIDYGDGRKDFKQERWNGKRWIPTLDGIDRADVPVYRYADIRQAIANKQPIFLVEGEPCADALWDLGLAATCNIGGCKKWKSSDTSDLAGAQVAVIVPDRDVPGIEHADCLAQEFSNAQWLYPYPESAAWNNLPKSQGLDIADWIENHNLTAEEILAAVGEKKLAALQTPAMPAKILSHPKFETPDLDNLGAEINELLDQDLKRSQLRTKLAGLAQKYRLSPGEVDKIYRDREQELEQETDREDVAAEVARLLNSKKSQINIAEIIPAGLAKPLAELAARLNLRPECYLATLLTQTSSLFKVGTEVKLRNDTDYRVTPNCFTAIVGESSQKKSPIMRAIIDRPMQPLRDKAREEYQKAYAEYESEYAAWRATKGENKGLPPKEPRQKLYSFSKTTGEGILYQVAEHPDQALMYRCDELAGLFKSANQYRGGKGSDDEDLLEFWNGTGSTVLRASGVKADLNGLLLSIFGTIQPDVLATLLKDCSDSNGKFARFDFVIQPLAASKLSLEDSGSFDVTPMLSDLYTKIDALPAVFFQLDRDAKRYFTEFYNAAEERRVAEPMQGKRAMIGKMPEKVGKLAAVIHTLNCVFDGKPVTPSIPKQAVEAAVNFVAFTSAQIDVLYTEFSDRAALAPNLAKIVSLAERKGGTISVRDVSKNFKSGYRPAGQEIREWFDELVSMKYGEITSSGRSFSFTLYPHPQLPPLTSNSITASDSITPISNNDYPHLPPNNLSNGGKWGVNGGTVTPILKSLPDMPLEANGGNGGKFSPPLQNSETLMMSCTTENEHQGTRDIEVGDRVEVVGSDIKHYNGVTGTVIDVWAKTNSWGCTVDFDKPVGNASFCDFPAYELRKLHDSDG